MNQTIKFATKIHEVSEFFDIAVPYMTDIDRQEIFGNKAQDLKKVKDDKVLFDDNRKDYLDVSKRTKFVTNDNNLLIERLKNGLNLLVADIPSTKISADDKRILNIIEWHHGNKIPVVTFSPLITIGHTAYLQITVVIANPETPNSTAMPHGHILFLETCITDEDIADAALVFGNGVIVSTAKHIMHFEVSDIKKTCHIRGRYENGHHERGPVSVIIRKTIA